MSDPKDTRVRDLVTPAQERDLRYAFDRGMAIAVGPLKVPYAEAEDIVGEAVLRAHERRDSYVPQEGKTFLSWFLQIVENLVRDAAKHRAVTARHLVSARVAMTSTAPVPADAKIANLGAAENRDRLLASLPEEAAPVFRVWVRQHARQITREQARKQLGLSMTEYEAAKKRCERKVLAAMRELGLATDDLLSSEPLAAGWDLGRGKEEEET
jgi:DNA-directed RNA polymerase specialized sigma24 family protein